MIQVPFDSIVTILSAKKVKVGNEVRAIDLKICGAPTAGNSKHITIYQLQRLNEAHNGDLEIIGKASPSEHRVIITSMARVRTRDGVKRAVQSLAESLQIHLGLTAFTQI